MTLGVLTSDQKKAAQNSSLSGFSFLCSAFFRFVRDETDSFV
jgi:hypothetical protein